MSVNLGHIMPPTSISQSQPVSNFEEEQRLSKLHEIITVSSRRFSNITKAIAEYAFEDSAANVADKIAELEFLENLFVGGWSSNNTLLMGLPFQMIKIQDSRLDQYFYENARISLLKEWGEIEQRKFPNPYSKLRAIANIRVETHPHLTCQTAAQTAFRIVTQVTWLHLLIAEYAWASPRSLNPQPNEFDPKLTFAEQIYNRIQEVEFGIRLTGSMVLKEDRVYYYAKLFAQTVVNNTKFRPVKPRIFSVITVCNSDTATQLVPFISGITNQFAAIRERMSFQQTKSDQANDSTFLSRTLKQLKEKYSFNKILNRKRAQFVNQLLTLADSNMVRELVDQGASLRYRDHNNYTVLQNAIHAFVCWIKKKSVKKFTHTLERLPPHGCQFSRDETLTREEQVSLPRYHYLMHEKPKNKFLSFIEWLIEKDSGTSQEDIDALRFAMRFSFNGLKAANNEEEITQLESLLMSRINPHKDVKAPQASIVSRNKRTPEYRHNYESDFTIERQIDAKVEDAFMHEIHAKKFNRTELFKEALGYSVEQNEKMTKSKLLIMSLIKNKLDSKLILGKAIDNGDCFFHAFAQTLNVLRHKRGLGPVDVLQLRKDVSGVLKDDTLAIHWIKDGAIPVWGDPASHGKVLCQIYRVNLKVFIADSGVDSAKAEELLKSKKSRETYFANKEGWIFGEDPNESVVIDPSFPTIEMVVARLHFMPVFNRSDLMLTKAL